MNILLVTNEFKKVMFSGGLGVYVDEIAEKLRSEGHTCYIFLNHLFKEAVPTRLNLIEGFTVIESTVLDKLEKDTTVNLLKLYLKINEIIDLIMLHNIHFDVIHVNDYINYPVGERLGSFFHVPVVSTVHSYALTHYFGAPLKVRFFNDQLNLHSERNKRKIRSRRSYLGENHVMEMFYLIEKRMIRNSDMVIYPSESVKNYAETLYGVDISTDRHRVVYNGMALIEPMIEDINQLIKRLKTKGHSVLLFCGRLVQQKGVSFLIDAMKLVLEKGHNAKLIVCGKGSEMNSLVNQAYRIGISEHVIFTGHLDREEILSLYQQADIGIVPSLWEPFGYTLIEMMYYGLPVITGDIDGPGEIIVDGVSGLKVKVDEDIRTGERTIDPEKLAEKIQLLLIDCEKSKQISRYARERVKNEYDINDMTGRVVSIYSELVR